MTLNRFFTIAGVTMERGLFHGFVREVMKVDSSDEEEDFWWKLLALFDSRWPLMVEHDAAGEYVRECLERYP